MTLANYKTPTKQTYDALDQAFHHFNGDLFCHRLPAPMFVIHRKRGARGYFWAEQFKHIETGERLDEIALNPESMGRTLPEVLSTLVHEMVHLQQQHEGKPGKGGNHNREWGTMMDAVGLTPTSTGAEGGKRTGRKVTHMIQPDGPFALSCADLLRLGFEMPWFTEAPDKKAKKADLSKVKHTCPGCDTKAWGKLGISLICGDCEIELAADDVTEGED